MTLQEYVEAVCRKHPELEGKFEVEYCHALPNKTRFSMPRVEVKFRCFPHIFIFGVLPSDSKGQRYLQEKRSVYWEYMASVESLYHDFQMRIKEIETKYKKAS